MSTRFRLSPLTAVRLEERSVSPEAVLRHAGLPPGLLRQDRILVTTEQLFAFWNAVAEASDDPEIGLKLGSEERIERQDVVTLAALSAPSFRDALERAARYKQLTCPEEITVVNRGRQCAVQFRWWHATANEPALLIDLCFAWIASLARRGTGGALMPQRVELIRSGRDRRVYESHFGCPVRFTSDANALVFLAADLDRPFVTHNVDLLGTLGPQLDAELAARNASRDVRDVRDEVTGVLRRLLPGGRPDLGDIARELLSSRRTLQRRLGESGVTYQELLEEARRGLAIHYLRHSTFELAEIAYLLGYEDSNSFFRAFSRWEGLPPGRWREARRAESRPSAVALGAAS